MCCDDSLYRSGCRRSCGNLEGADCDRAEGPLDHWGVAEEISGGDVGRQAVGEGWECLVQWYVAPFMSMTNSTEE